MHKYEEFIDKEARAILRQGEQIIVKGLGKDTMTSVLANLFPWMKKYYFLVLTNQRLIVITPKVKLQFLLALPAWDWGPIPERVELRTIELGDIQKITLDNTQKTVGGMLFAWIYGIRGICFWPRVGDKVNVLVRRSESRYMGEAQKDFYERIIGEAKQRTQLASAS